MYKSRRAVCSRESLFSRRYNTKVELKVGKAVLSQKGPLSLTTSELIDTFDTDRRTINTAKYKQGQRCIANNRSKTADIGNMKKSHNIEDDRLLPLTNLNKAVLVFNPYSRGKSLPNIGIHSVDNTALTKPSHLMLQKECSFSYADYWMPKTTLCRKVNTREYIYNNIRDNSDIKQHLEDSFLDLKRRLCIVNYRRY